MRFLLAIAPDHLKGWDEYSYEATFVLPHGQHIQCATEHLVQKGDVISFEAPTLEVLGVRGKLIDGPVRRFAVNTVSRHGTAYLSGYPNSLDKYRR